MAGYRGNNRGGNRNGNNRQQQRGGGNASGFTHQERPQTSHPIEGEIVGADEGAMIPASGPDRAVAIASHSETRVKEVEAAVVIAHKNPRNEDAARATLIRQCEHPLFAEKCCYRYPRGDGNVCGPSIVMAREMARCWRNIRSGFSITADDEDNRTIEAYAWDMETNEHVTQQATFRKLIYRKKGGWVTPDERDLLELTNRQASKAVRNCLLACMPWLTVQELIAAAEKTLNDQAAKDPDATRKNIADGFTRLNVPIHQIEEFIGCGLARCSPAQLATLRQVWKTIESGEQYWSDYYKPKKNDAVEPDPKTAGAFAGATAETTDRPRSTPTGDRRAYLPKSLQQPETDKRPEAEYLLDVVATGDEATVNSVLAYLGNATHLAGKDKLALMRAATARASDFAGDASEKSDDQRAGQSSDSNEIPFSQAAEAATTTPPPPEEPLLPGAVRRAIKEMQSRAGADMGVHTAYNVRWLNVVKQHPELDEYTPLVAAERDKLLTNPPQG